MSWFKVTADILPGHDWFPPLNDVWEMTVEIPYWWHVTTHAWVALLIG